jgi:hypothetical protein
VPAAIEALAGGRPLRAVWRNELGGLTFEIGTGADRRFVKWAPAGSALDLDREAARLAWARAFTPVPAPVELGADEAGSWLVTAALRGESAVSARWRADPATAVRAIGSGLRALHRGPPPRGLPLLVVRRGASRRHPPGSGRRQARSGNLARRPQGPPTSTCPRSPGNPAADRQARRLSWGRLRPQHPPGRRRPLVRPRRSGRPWNRRSLGRPCGRDLEHDLELWARVGGCPPRRLDIDPDAHRMRYYRLLWDLGP